MRELGEPPVDLLRGASLFLDFDGTLVDLAPTPDAVQVSSRLRELLARLHRCLDGRVALLSGRSIDDLLGHLHPVTLAIAGSHGLERTGLNNEIVAPPAPDTLAEAVHVLRGVQDHHPGVLIEEKPFGVAIHFRLAPEAEEACRFAATEVANQTGMVVQAGKMVFELKPSSGTKGGALRAFMAEPPFLATRPVFLGDDLTDEYGFEAAMDLGGAGVLVGEERGTAAIYRLPGTRAARDWLTAACEALA
jgi:trehalose 6-phosphate phosphatase